LGVTVHAGHGLDYRNVERLTHLEEIEEFSIGHSIIARAVLVGMDQAVREMLEKVKG
jgi:pyridoxine 5-phosphate synthase